MVKVERYVLGYDHLLEDGTHYLNYRGASTYVDKIQKAKFFQRGHAISSMKSNSYHVLREYKIATRLNPSGEMKKVVSIKPFLIPFVANELNREYIEVD